MNRCLSASVKQKWAATNNAARERDVVADGHAEDEKEDWRLSYGESGHGRCWGCAGLAGYKCGYCTAGRAGIQSF
jgi:hypothetical protein